MPTPAARWRTHLDAFKRWYAQAGTPRLQARGRCTTPRPARYTLTLRQQRPPSPGQPGEQAALRDPGAMGLLAADGQALPLQLEGEAAPRGTDRCWC
jgi:aminopeptidase N